MIFLPNMKTGLIFLLLSGVVLVSCNFTRRFHLVNQMLNWADAQRYCRKHFTDLATIQDSEQHANAKVVATRKGWIGLFKVWQWSLAHNNVRRLTGFTNWGSGEWDRRFVVISGDGKWNTKGWTQKYPFICYKAQTNSHFLVPEPLNWYDARSRCRNMSAELSSIRDQQENTIVAALMTNQGEAWIGLFTSPWMWSNGGNVPYNNWGEDQIQGHKPRCTMLGLDGKWYRRLCEDKQYFLCHTDIPHKDVRSVKIQLRGGSADLNDPAVQESILQQLKQKMDERDLRGVKLRWKIQPDGKVFHKEKEEEERMSPSGDCEDVI